MIRLSVAIALTSLALAAPAGAALSTPHSGWQWGSPQPQGHNLYALDMEGSVGYATGDFGTLLSTADAGSTWSTVKTGLMLDLTRVDVIDSDSVVFGSDCALRRTDDGGLTFRRLPFTSSESRCARRLIDIAFPTSDIGYLLSDDGGILKTTDGGQSFAAVAGPPTAASGFPSAMEFTTADLGLVVTAGGDIYRTTDGGATWTLEYDGATRLIGLYFSGPIARAVGSSGTFLVSDDGGDNWTQPAPVEGAPPRPSEDLVTVSCAGTICLVRNIDRRVYRTTDDGRTLTPLPLESTSAVDFASPTRAVVVGLGGRTWLSDDGGASFAGPGFRLPTAVSRLRVRALSIDIAQVAGLPRAIAATRDGGETWALIGVPTREEVRDVSFSADNLGYVLDAAGGVFRTTNGGGRWSILDVGVTDPPLAVYAPNAQTVLLIGPRGVLRSTDGGETFSRHSDSDVRVRTLTDVDRAGSGAMVVFGPRVITMSTNNGRTFRRIVRPTQGAEVASVDFASPRIGYVLETDGRLYKTVNGGRKWAEVIGAGYTTGRQLAFGSARSGWLTTAEFPSTVLRTTDGGQSWHPQVIGNGGEVTIASRGSRFGIASFSSGPDPSLVFTDAGGDAGRETRLTISTEQRVLRRARRIEILGRLTPASGGEEVEVRVRSLRGRRWRVLRTTADRAGRFSVDYRVRGGTIFVAQWAGDRASAGDGTAPLVVRIRR